MIKEADKWIPLFLAVVGRVIDRGGGMPSISHQKSTLRAFLPSYRFSYECNQDFQFSFEWRYGFSFETGLVIGDLGSDRGGSGNVG